MSGHSKWANIKRRKGRADIVKGKIFSRIAKEIISAVKQGGPDVRANNKLKLAVQKAKEANVPNDTVERNIKKASSGDQKDFSEFTYEIYGHGGVGLILDIMTDNKNRIASDIRGIINKKGGVVANPGAVAFNFDKKGVIRVSKEKYTEDELFLMASEAGADDFSQDDDFYLVITAPENLYAVKQVLDSKGVKVESEALEMVPKTLVECSEENAKANFELIDALEELEDVDATYHNMAT